MEEENVIDTILKDSKSEEELEENKKGNHWVELDLPSGNLWGSCNIGAELPWEYGDYYSWGNLQVDTCEYKSEFLNSLYLKDNELLKNLGIITSSDSLISNYDIASYKINKGRMPTEADFEELMSYCNWTWVTSITDEEGNSHEITGWKVKSLRSDNYIFLPASGNKIDCITRLEGLQCNYWTSTIHPGKHTAKYAHMYENDKYISFDYRYTGMSVRAVKDDPYPTTKKFGKFYVGTDDRELDTMYQGRIGVDDNGVLKAINAYTGDGYVIPGTVTLCYSNTLYSLTFKPLKILLKNSVPHWSIYYKTDTELMGGTYPNPDYNPDYESSAETITVLGVKPRVKNIEKWLLGDPTYNEQGEEEPYTYDKEKTIELRITKLEENLEKIRLALNSGIGNLPCVVAKAATYSEIIFEE